MLTKSESQRRCRQEARRLGRCISCRHHWTLAGKASCQECIAAAIARVERWRARRRVWRQVPLWQEAC